MDDFWSRVEDLCVKYFNHRPTVDKENGRDLSVWSEGKIMEFVFSNGFLSFRIKGSRYVSFDKSLSFPISVMEGFTKDVMESETIDNFTLSKKNQLLLNVKPKILEEKGLTFKIANSVLKDVLSQKYYEQVELRSSEQKSSRTTIEHKLNDTSKLEIDLTSAIEKDKIVNVTFIDSFLSDQVSLGDFKALAKEANGILYDCFIDIATSKVLSFLNEKK